MQQIILLKDVDGLGRRGGVVKVKDGYALNFILPQGMGVRATPDNLKRLAGLRKKFEVEEQERTEQAKGLSERLEGASVTIPMKASEDGHLYGSVTVSTITEALAADGIELDSRAVKLVDPIKDVGVYSVPIVLHEQVKTELKVWVVEEKQAEVETSGKDAATETEAS